MTLRLGRQRFGLPLTSRGFSLCCLIALLIGAAIVFFKP